MLLLQLLSEFSKETFDRLLLYYVKSMKPTERIKGQGQPSLSRAGLQENLHGYYLGTNERNNEVILNFEILTTTEI